MDCSHGALELRCVTAERLARLLRGRAHPPWTAREPIPWPRAPFLPPAHTRPTAARGAWRGTHGDLQLRANPAGRHARLSTGRAQAEGTPSEARRGDTLE